MNAQTYERAITLAELRQHLFLSSTDRTGLPHIASVGSFRRVSDDEVALGDLWCPATWANVGQNPRVAMIVWDIVTDTGYQLLGEVRAIEIVEPDADEDASPLTPPQLNGGSLERELIVHVDQALTFSHAPHADEEERGGTVDLTQATHPPAKLHASSWQGTYLYLGHHASGGYH